MNKQVVFDAPTGARIGEGERSGAHKVMAQFRFEFLSTLRRGESVLVTILIPLLLLIFFGSVPIFESSRSAQLQQLVPGLLVLAVMSTGMVSLGIATAFERQYGVLKRLGASPLTRPQLLMAKGLTTLCVVLIQVAVLLAVASLVFGWRPEGNGWLTGLLVLAGLITFTGIGLWMAGALRAEATLGLANGLYLVLLLLGGIVVPVNSLPGALASVVHFLPSAALADLLRGALDSSYSSSAISVPILVFWVIATPLAAARWFRWE